MSRTPKVSVLTTAFNPGRYLDVALESVWAQSYKDFELILIDNGCSDGSIDQLSTQPNDRFVLDRHVENIGRTPALNRALGMARGQYVAVLDADDVWHPDHLSRLVQELDDDERLVLAGTWCIWIDGQDREFLRTRYPADRDGLCDRMAWQNPFIHSTTLYRREVANRVGGYDEAFEYAHDFDLWLKLFQHGDATIIAEYLTQIRAHTQNASDRPQLALNRLHDKILLYRRAAGQFNIGMPARLANRKVLADAAMQLGANLVRKGRYAEACKWSLWSIGQDPLVYIRSAVRRIRGRN